jgi:hypothetical protein
MKFSKYYAQCVKYALQQKGIREDDFENTDLRVYHRNVANPKTVCKALNKGAIVIPLVSSTLFTDTADEEWMATILLEVCEEKGEARLYNPLVQQECVKPLDAFVTAWIASGGSCTTAFSNDGTYVPKLIDLTHIELPSELDELMEAVAENAHDMWAMERQSEGWTYGPERNDQLLQTPDMVPYAQLTDSEKEYDRIMSKDTIRLFIALGYKIVKE